MNTVEQLRARMAEPGYQPILAKPVVIAMMFKVTRQAVSNWMTRSDRTGVHRHDGGLCDVNEAALWVLTRDEQQAARRGTE